MKRYINQCEQKNLSAGEMLINKQTKDNLLVFVSSGNLHISNNKLNIEIKEGHFFLLAANTYFAVKATINSRLLLIYTGELSKMIIEDPEWNPESPLILPIPPTLATVLSQIEYYKKEHTELLN